MFGCEIILINMFHCSKGGHEAHTDNNIGEYRWALYTSGKSLLRKLNKIFIKIFHYNQ